MLNSWLELTICRDSSSAGPCLPGEGRTSVLGVNTLNRMRLLDRGAGGGPCTERPLLLPRASPGLPLLFRGVRDHASADPKSCHRGAGEAGRAEGRRQRCPDSACPSARVASSRPTLTRPWNASTGLPGAHASVPTRLREHASHGSANAMLFLPQPIR